MGVIGRAAALRVVQEEQDQEERERAHQKREREIDGYLSDVLTCLKNRKDIEFAAGEISELAPRIKANIKLKLLEEPSLNYFTAKQRVRQLVDEWIENSLNDRDAE